MRTGVHSVRSSCAPPHVRTAVALLRQAAQCGEGTLRTRGRPDHEPDHGPDPRLLPDRDRWPVPHHPPQGTGAGCRRLLPPWPVVPQGRRRSTSFRAGLRRGVNLPDLCHRRLLAEPRRSALLPHPANGDDRWGRWRRTAWPNGVAEHVGTAEKSPLLVQPFPRPAGRTWHQNSSEGDPGIPWGSDTEGEAEEPGRQIGFLEVRAPCAGRAQPQASGLRLGDSDVSAVTDGRSSRYLRSPRDGAGTGLLPAPAAPGEAEPEPTGS